jgi:hypothetical protein
MLRSLLPCIVLGLVGCSCPLEEQSTIPKPKDPLRREFIVRLTYCDTSRGDTSVYVTTFDGRPPTSDDITSLHEPMPVYRIAGLAVFNVCNLEVIGEKATQELKGSEMILSTKDSVVSVSITAQ